MVEQTKNPVLTGEMTLLSQRPRGEMIHSERSRPVHRNMIEMLEVALVLPVPKIDSIAIGLYCSIATSSKNNDG